MNKIEKLLVIVGRTFFVCVCAFLVVWILTWAFHFAADTSDKPPFTLYSAGIDDFAMFKNEDSGKHYYDAHANEYTEAQFYEMLPTFYCKQLIVNEKLPDTLYGRPVSAKFIQNENFTFKTAPAAVNKREIALYPLMESMSGRVDLEMPTDVFRITENAIEFVDMATNSVDETKSDLFTKMFVQKGFAFPAHIISGNPTTKKEYDNGYLITDSNDKLFHLKMQRGRPYLRHIELPDGIVPKHIFVTEFRNQRSLAFISDTENRFWMLDAKNYGFRKAEIPDFNPETDGMMIIGNFHDWTVSVSSGDQLRYFALAADDLHCLKSYEVPTEEPTKLQRIGNILIPIQLKFLSGLDGDVWPRVAIFGE